jgi:hypothetical protein
MLTLKLLLVPAFLLAITLAGRRWGAAVAGWLAGLPVVTGPILAFLTLEQGASFAATAAAAALSAVFASVSFSLVYAHAALRLPWWAALVLAMAGWTGAATLLWWLQASALPPLAMGLAIALTTLVVAPRLFPALHGAPPAAPQRPTRAALWTELACRMLAGALLTLAVTWGAAAFGAGWSGLLAVFPILGIVLAVFSHRSQGAVFAATLLRGMATGLYSFIAFCFVLAWTLPQWHPAVAFAVSVVASLVVQVTSRRVMQRHVPRASRP